MRLKPVVGLSSLSRATAAAAAASAAASAAVGGGAPVAIPPGCEGFGGCW